METARRLVVFGSYSKAHVAGVDVGRMVPHIRINENCNNYRQMKQWSSASAVITCLCVLTDVASLHGGIQGFTDTGAFWRW